MKKFTSLFAALLLLVPAFASAAEFEGKVKMKMTTPQGPADTTMSIKSGFFRMDLAMGGMEMATIADYGKKEIYMLMPMQNMYMAQPLKTDGPETANAEPEATVEKTSETAKIAGYDTTKWVSKAKDGTVTEVWMTEQLGTFTSISPRPQRGQGGPSNAWEKAFKGKNAFPLKMVSKTGGQEFKMEATAVEKQTLPASLFQVPQGMQKMDMPGMGGMGR